MKATNTALILIDMQKESEFGIYNTQNAVDNAEKLIALCRSLNVPVIYTRHINRADTVGLSNHEPLDSQGEPVFYNNRTQSIEIIDQIQPTNDDIIVNKYRWSGFFNTSLDKELKNLGVKHVIMGGFVTDGCLMTSVFDAYFRDYQVHLVKDICSTTNEGAHMASILIMANWIYDLSIYETTQMLKKLSGKSYSHWESAFPDELKFTPENLRDVYSYLGQ